MNRQSLFAIFFFSFFFFFFFFFFYRKQSFTFNSNGLLRKKRRNTAFKYDLLLFKVSRLKFNPLKTGDP